MSRRMLPGLLIVIGSLAFAPVASAAPPAAPFVLAQGNVEGAAVAGDVPGFGAAMAAIEITGAPGSSGGRIPPEGSVSNLAFTGQMPPWEPPYKATGELSMTGTMDPTTGAVTGRFAWAVPDLTITGDVATGGVVTGQATLNMSVTWSGEVTGTVDADTAELAFSGSRKSTCKITTTDANFRGGDCTGPTGAYEVLVTFTVTGAAETEAPGGPTPEPGGPTPAPGGSTLEPVGVTKDIAGDVYVSPASEKDLEPSQRTWTPLKPGQKIPMEEGAILRTGRDGTVAVVFSTGALTRLGPSTLFGLKGFKTSQTSQWTMYSRLYQGICDFYMQKWKESGKKFEVETDRAIVGIKGTVFQIAVTDTATVVTVAEGVVAVTDKATGTVIDVGAGERATVDAAGMTKVAAPDAAALLDENAEPAASAPVAASPATESAPTPAPVAAVSSADAASTSPAPATPSGTDSGGSSLPLVLGIVAAIVVVVAAGLALLRLKARTPSTGA